MGSPFRYIDRKESRVTFFRRFGDGDPMGECELFLLWHCDSRGLTAKEAGRVYCDKRARDLKTVLDIAVNQGRCRSEKCMCDGLAQFDAIQKD
jgi:hypothetical protein